MSGNPDHDVAGLQSGTVDGSRYVDDDAIGPIERDDCSVRRCIEAYRDGDHAEQD
jgi:hypothetical protein